ncbi:ABC transporter ATP-binding protein [Ancylobacter sonchi]|uniref:ABC transporter ATP-binding protein n=1 Tax=Ancylobacter sonchi TaxID=1937790 RepID=UPI001BD44FAB|nr:ABC transporter ATP-binding protein [Ancylobacter sonchi]MBS7535338.1 ABC transporter ATP-binding protein [Ancylobacter sonchi]
MPHLVARNLTKSFDGVRAVDQVSFAIPDGAFLALLGPSGCGKTTLLRMIAGLEDPDAGELLFDDVAVAGPRGTLPPEARRLGMVFQSYALWPHMTVRGNIEFGLKVQKLPAAERRRRIEEVLEVVGLSGHAARRPHELSGGQRQRVALARSLALRPGLILLDEPLANLDAHLRETMLAEFRRIHSMTGATFVFVTHDQEEAMAVATHVAVMNRGRLEQVGTPEDLYRRPQTESVARFIGRGRTLPVEVMASQDGLCTIALAGGVLKVAGLAPPGPGWLCFHASDLSRAPQRGPFAGEVVNQLFQNGVYATELAPLGVDVETVSLALPERLAPGTRIEVGLSGGWVIARAPSAAPALTGAAARSSA